MLKKILNITKPSPAQATQGINILIDAWKENKKIHEVETTKRADIQARKEVELERIQSQTKLLELYFENVFSERKQMISGMFDALDRGIETDNFDLTQQSLGSIVAIAKESPLAGIQSLVNDFHDPDVKQITI